MHEGAVVGAEPEAELAHSLQKWQRFDVPHRAAHFDDGHFHGVGSADARAALDVFLDFVGDVRDHLHRFAQIFATALFFDHALIDAAGGEIVGLLHARFDETLIVPQVKIGLGAVISHEHFAMLERRHRSGIDVDIGIELDQGDLQAP